MKWSTLCFQKSPCVLLQPPQTWPHKVAGTPWWLARTSSVAKMLYGAPSLPNSEGVLTLGPRLLGGGQALETVSPCTETRLNVREREYGVKHATMSTWINKTRLQQLLCPYILERVRMQLYFTCMICVLNLKQLTDVNAYIMHVYKYAMESEKIWHASHKTYLFIIIIFSVTCIANFNAIWPEALHHYSCNLLPLWFVFKCCLYNFICFLSYCKCHFPQLCNHFCI